MSKCTNSSTDQRPCANQSFIDSLFTTQGELFASLIYVNPIINPGSDEYLRYYIEDMNFISFSTTQGGHSVGEI